MSTCLVNSLSNILLIDLFKEDIVVNLTDFLVAPHATTTSLAEKDVFSNWLCSFLFASRHVLICLEC